MRFETALLQALTAHSGPAADACLRWLVDGTPPVRPAIDIAWPAELD